MKKNKPFFSIVIPTLNEERYLPGLLKDLSKQAFQNFNVIIVDGQSTDETISKTLQFKNKLDIKIVKSEKRNVAHQRNLGARNVETPWILFMDADNRLPNYFLEGVKYKIARDKPDLFTCWCRVDGHSTGDRAIENYLNITEEIGQLVDYPSALGAMIGISNKGFKKTEGFNSKIVPLEDGRFIRDAVDKGLKFKLFRDPRFIYSLRRLRQSGKLRSIQKYAQLHMKKLSRIPINHKLEYPMGGAVLNTGEGRKFTEDLSSRFQEAVRLLAERPKIRQKIKRLITIVENGL